MVVLYDITLFLGKTICKIGRTHNKIDINAKEENFNNF